MSDQRVPNTRRDFLKTLPASAAALAVGERWTRRGLAAEDPQRPLVTAVRDLGVQFLDNPVNITGQDAATSALLPDGKALWMFGDTVEGPFESIRNHVLTGVLSNTAAMVPRQDVSRGIKDFEYLATDDGKRARQLIEFTADEQSSRHRLWPMHSVCVDNFIHTYYHKITMDPKVDVFENFELNGMGIARARIGEYRFRRLVAPDGTREFWKGDEPTFGVFTELLPDGFLYVWGCFWTGMFLARTRPAGLADLGSYEYLIAAPTRAAPHVTPRWSPTFEPTAPLFDSVPNELSVAYHRYLGRHLAVHVLNRENKLVVRTAPQITGPWSEPEVFFRPALIKSNDLFTAGKEHPELRRDGGRVCYVTYVNSSVYVPHLLEVQLRGGQQ